MKKRRLLFPVLFFCLICGFALLLTIGAGAESQTVSDAAGLKTALAGATDGDVITLSSSFTLSETLTVNAAVTIDGDDHTISTTASRAFVVNDDLTLHNVTVSGNGSSRLVNVPTGASPTLTISGNSTLTAGAELPIYSEGSPKIVINGDYMGTGVHMSGNHGVYFAGGSPQITISGKVDLDLIKCGIYAVNTEGAVITVNGTDVTIKGGETGVYVENANTPTTPAAITLKGTLTMNVTSKYGVEAKTKAAAQVTVEGDVTINANYCLVSSTENAMHMTVQGNAVLKANENPIHFNHEGDVLRNVYVAGNAKLSGKQIVSYGAAVALTFAEYADVSLIEIILNTRSSSLTVTGNAKLTCSRNIRFAPKAGNTASFTASGNATVTTNGTGSYFGIHFTSDGAGNGKVVIKDNAYLSTAVHATVAQNKGTYSFEMTGGTIRAKANACVWTGPDSVNTVKIYGGTLIADAGYTMELKGKTGSAFDIYGGSVICTVGHAAIEAKGTVTVNIWGGYFEGHEKSCVRPCESATLNIYGGYFYYGGALNSEGSTVRSGVAADTQSPTVNLYGGRFVSTSSHDGVFHAIAPKGYFNIAENAVFSCQGGDAILVSDSAYVTTLRYTGAIHRYSSSAAPERVTGAQLRLTEGSTGIRFTTHYPKEAVEYFNAIADAGTVTYGTLIVPVDYLDGISAFTLDALAKAGLAPLNLTAQNGLIQNDDGSVTVRAAITNIKPQNLGRSFTAIGYVCYEKDDTLVYFYTDHHQADHSRSIRQLAQLALEDVNENKTTTYKYDCGNGTYSPYSRNQRNYLTNNFYDPSTEEKKTVDLYLIAGQSNAAGYSYFNNAFLQTNSAFANGYENVLYAGSAVGTLGTFLTPHTIDVTTTKAGFGQLDTYIGPELGIADALSQYYTNSANKAAIVKYAVGSSCLWDNVAGASAAGGNWYPPSMIEANGATSQTLTGNLYRLFMDQVATSIEDLEQMGYAVSIKGIYWMQGEGDRGNVDTYPTMLRALISDMRRDLGALSGEDLSALPFVVGEISASFFRDQDSYNTNFVEMQQQLPTLLADVGNVYVINSSPLSTGTNSSDAGHWTAEDMLLIGQMAGNVFAEQVKNATVTDPTQNGDNVAEVLDADGNHVAYYSHLAYAINTAPTGGTVKLLCDLTLCSALNISNPGAIVLDGNGYTLTSKSGDHAVRIVGGDVTMNDMRIVHTSTSGAVYGFYLYDGAKLTFNSGYVECEEYNFCLNVADVTLIINGGTFKTRRGADETICNLVIGKAKAVIINGGDFVAANKASCVSIRSGWGGLLQITGGSFTTTSGKYCLHNPDTGSSISISDLSNVTFSGATAGNVHNEGNGYKG